MSSNTTDSEMMKFTRLIFLKYSRLITELTAIKESSKELPCKPEYRMTQPRRYPEARTKKNIAWVRYLVLSSESRNMLG